MLSSFAGRFSRIGNVLKFLNPETVDDKFLDEKNLYKRDIITAALNLELYEEGLVSTKGIAREIDKIAFLAFTGGAVAGRCAAGYIPNLVQLLEREDLRNDLKVSILRAVSVLALNVPDTQAKCFEEGIFSNVCSIVAETRDQVQQWAIYCLYSIVYDNIPYLQILKEQAKTCYGLSVAAEADWTGFAHNYASIILKLTGIERVKLTAKSRIAFSKSATSHQLTPSPSSIPRSFDPPELSLEEMTEKTDKQTK